MDDCTCIEGAETGGEHHEPHCAEYPSPDADADPNEDLIGFRFLIRGEGDLPDYYMTVTGSASWSANYVTVESDDKRITTVRSSGLVRQRKQAS